MSAAVLGAGLLLSVAGSAGASPTPTLAQVQKKVTQLQSKFDLLGQKFDQVQQQLASTNQRLSLVKQQLTAFSGNFKTMQAQVAKIAIANYEGGNLNSALTLLTSGDPQQVLSQSSILAELSASDNAQIGQFLAAARLLQNTEQVALRTHKGILQLKDSLIKRKAIMNKLLSQEQALLAQLTPVQQVAVSGGTGTTTGKYTGPTATQAEKAVKFAYDQLGCWYVYGGTGPCSQGFDCSGLTQQAWAYAGVSIERTSYDQWGSLPHVSITAVQPGDILVMWSAGHVALYVGHNQFIEAPQPGQQVHLVAYQGASTPGIVGAVRP